MFAQDNLNKILRDVMGCINRNASGSNSNKNKSNNNSNGNNKSNGNKLSITPAQTLVIAGIIGGVLDVDSILVDRDQVVQIVLEGSLKQKTELEKMLDEIGSMPFNEVVKAMLDRLQ